jgi:hypothetical protein
MTRSRHFPRISLRSVRWLLPWITVLFVSATLAYAMNSALHGGTSANSAAQALPDHSLAAEACSEIGSGLTPVGVDGWNVPEGHRIACNRAILRGSGVGPGQPDRAAARRAAASGGTFGVMSNTSPASTGHASSDGCCTWD